MTFTERYDKLLTGIISGVLLPLIIFVFIFMFSAGDASPEMWLNRMRLSGTATHIISLCVFPNVLIFLLFNHFDMLRASRGVLAITIIWAILVFIVKFFA